MRFRTILCRRLPNCERLRTIREMLRIDQTNGLAGCRSAASILPVLPEIRTLDARRTSANQFGMDEEQLLGDRHSSRSPTKAAWREAQARQRELECAVP